VAGERPPAAPEPAEIYDRTREEGRRRLARPALELAATALVGGFDVAFGIAAYALAAGSIDRGRSDGVGHLVGAIAFGIGFVFVVVGRSELFTENFLVPITGLSRERGSWLKLGELWVVSLVLNLGGGAALAVVLTSHDVLHAGTSKPIVGLAEHVAGYSPGTAFLSGIIAGALMTLMTWFVEGAADSIGVRIVMGWLVGTLLVLGGFNHAIVSSIELFYGLRFGADIGWDQLASNLALSVAANVVGGLALVTFARSAQAFGAART
jgi:formate-nitrite transporter family protein